MTTHPFPNFPHLALQTVDETGVPTASTNRCALCLNGRGSSGIRCFEVPCTPSENPDKLPRILVLREPAQVQFIPARRKTNPATSKAAAVLVTPKAPPLRERIVAMLVASGPATGTELAKALDAKLNSVTPRFAELSTKGVARIRDSGIRRDGQIVWAAL